MKAGLAECSGGAASHARAADSLAGSSLPGLLAQPTRAWAGGSQAGPERGLRGTGLGGAAGRWARPQCAGRFVNRTGTVTFRLK